MPKKFEEEKHKLKKPQRAFDKLFFLFFTVNLYLLPVLKTVLNAIFAILKIYPGNLVRKKFQ